jgi:predicted RNA-binding Zn-ribbon protein involved in translation (DUF1610 family)
MDDEFERSEDDDLDPERASEDEADDEGPRELDPREREDIESDLEDLLDMRVVFEPQGVRGVVIACPDCGSNHYYDWDLLKENLEHMLKTGEPQMHEPAFEPREEDYVQWDYGKGYIDALADAGVERIAAADLKVCPWCESALEDAFAFCPTCGHQLAQARLFRQLVDGGMEEHEARAMLTRAGFDPL